MVLSPLMLKAQLTYGVTGLLHAPSGEMQEDKTVMLGAFFLNKELTPPHWYYNTYSYFMNVTIMPWMEVTYMCTLHTAESMGLDKYGYSGFTNQDRNFAARFRIAKEGQWWKHMPAVAVGIQDPFAFSSRKVNAESGNGYLSRMFIAATKHVKIGREEIGIHLSYLYNTRRDYDMNGIAGGITYSPSFHPQLTLIADYDTRDVAVGASYLLFNHIHAMFELQRMKYFSGGITFKFVL
ncbi:YjbH domain-containing protein [uncultured Bacteroides sp.]|uniref:YjbH domain-containing protein n=1 Tax=uncultured Bacteroides sp. TaxID=162156 RepID=UPI00260B4A4C|nr:YjbH domain-containing protein [uncultured Bacteroides sp.]